MPFLRKINADTNLITTITTLEKCFMLKKLSIANNPISGTEKLT